MLHAELGRWVVVATGLMLGNLTSLAGRQASPLLPPGSANLRLQSHMPLGGDYTVGDVEIEQELARPYAYVTRTWSSPGFDVISVKDPGRARVLYSWQIENPELHAGLGGSDGQYFKHRGRYYYAESFQFVQSGPDADLGAIIFDVTGLPDTSRVKEVVRLRTKDAGARWGGFHTLSPYKHSDGRVLLFATNAYIPDAMVYDLGKLVETPTDQAPLSKVPSGPGTTGSNGYHDFYLAYDPATHQDKFYGAGLGSGYFVWDVTRPEAPKLVTSITGIAGLAVGHTFQVTPDGRYAVTQMEYQYAPVRIFDLKPGLDGSVKTISRPIGAWAGNWKLASHNNEIRWPYVFIASFADGLQVVNLMDPTNPYTVGTYDTHSGSLLHGLEPDRNLKGARESNSIFDGAFGVDVRNADGLIVISDIRTGFWSFKMDGFDGWNGHQWGMPNVSSAQDWDAGPDGAPKPSKVS